MPEESRVKKNVTSTPVAKPKTVACPLCRGKGGALLWQDKHCRIVIVRDTDYAGYCRVIWNTHIKEMTDLSVQQRAHCMRVVFAVEQAVRTVFMPDKINLASFGNMAPHLHWHVIPRFVGDAHFPNPVWGKRQRTGKTAMAKHTPANWRTALRDQLVRLL